MTTTTHRRRGHKSAAHAHTPAAGQSLQASILQAAEALIEELRAGKSARFEQLLRFSSRFHHYSLGNQLLISLQCPEATRVAGYRTWEQMGYHVAKGQHGIRILAPRVWRRRDDQVDDALREGGVSERSAVSFASVPVFDVSQLNPEELAAKPLPSFYHDLGTDDETEALCTRIVAAMTRSGITVEELDGDRFPSAEHQGFSAGGYVAVRRGLPSRNRLRTLDAGAHAAALVDSINRHVMTGCRFYSAGPRPRDLILWIDPPASYLAGRFYPDEFARLYRAARAAGLCPIRESVREWTPLWERTPEGRYGYGH